MDKTSHFKIQEIHEKRTGQRSYFDDSEVKKMAFIDLPGLSRDRLGEDFVAAFHRAQFLAVEIAPCAFLLRAIYVDHVRCGYSIGFLDATAAKEFRRRARELGILCA